MGSGLASFCIGVVTSVLLYVGIRLFRGDQRTWMRASFLSYSLCVVFASILLSGELLQQPDLGDFTRGASALAWALPPLVAVFYLGPRYCQSAR